MTCFALYLTSVAYILYLPISPSPALAVLPSRVALIGDYSLPYSILDIPGARVDDCVFAFRRDVNVVSGIKIYKSRDKGCLTLHSVLSIALVR